MLHMVAFYLVALVSIEIVHQCARFQAVNVTGGTLPMSAMNMGGTGLGREVAMSSAKLWHGNRCKKQ